APPPSAGASSGAPSPPGGASPGGSAPRRHAQTPPASGADDAEQRERLASLGYVGGSVAPGSPPPPGPHVDPKVGIQVVRDLDRARGLLQTGRPSDAAAILEPIAKRELRNFPVLATLGAA